jgi:hypothetical protein
LWAGAMPRIAESLVQPSLAELLGQNQVPAVAQSQNPALAALIAAAMRKRQMQSQVPMMPPPMIGVRG